MANRTHYPGPYHVEKRGDAFFTIVSEEGVEIAVCDYSEEDESIDPITTTDGRTAQLLAKAPELLAALEGLLAAHDGSVDIPMYRLDLPARRKDLKAIAMRTARAAIRQARGV